MFTLENVKIAWLDTDDGELCLQIDIHAGTYEDGAYLESIFKIEKFKDLPVIDIIKYANMFLEDANK